MLLKDKLTKYNHYRVSKYFDYFDLGYGERFNYYFPQMFVQKGLLPKNIIRDPIAIRNSLILNLFPNGNTYLEIYHTLETNSEIPQEVKDKFNIKSDKLGIPGKTLPDKITSVINSVQSQVKARRSKNTNLSFLEVKKIKSRKIKRIARLKRVLKSSSFANEIGDLKELIKLSKKRPFRAYAKKRRYSNTRGIKHTMKNLKHKVLPIILKQKTILKQKKLKLLSMDSSVFFEKCNSAKSKPKTSINDNINSNQAIAANDVNSITVTDYLKTKKAKGRARINQFNWALIGFSKLKYKSLTGQPILIPIYFRTNGGQSMSTNEHNNHKDTIHYNENNISKTLRFFETDATLASVITNSSFLDFPKVFTSAFIPAKKFKKILSYRKILYYISDH